MAHKSKEARGLITAILNKTGQKGSPRVAYREQLETYSLADIKKVWARVNVAAAAQQVPAKRKSTAKQSTTKQKPAARAGTKRRSTAKIPDAQRKRRDRIQRAIASGKIKPKGGKKKATQMAGATPRDRVYAFNSLYKGVVIPTAAKPKQGTKAKAKPKAKASISTIYAGIKAKGKKPYYVTQGYNVKAYSVGGGKRGPGIIRAVPKSNAAPFSKLTEAQQAAVVKFLNSGAGKALRSKGAPASVSITALRKIAKQKAAKAKAK